MTRRLSLAGQLLALQVFIICVVLLGVAAVTVAQTIQGAHEVEGRRALAAGEFVANARTTRDAILFFAWASSSAVIPLRCTSSRILRTTPTLLTACSGSQENVVAVMPLP